MNDSQHKPPPLLLDETTAPAKAGVGLKEKIGRYRWRICALLFFATTLNYIDRQVLGLLKPVLEDPIKGIGLSEVEFGYIVTAFFLAYAIGLLVIGRLIDKVGTRIGYTIAVAVWGVAAAGHSLVSFPSVVRLLGTVLHNVGRLIGMPWLMVLPAAVVGFAIVRFFLGLGESSNFPACIKTVAEWFPQKERALATGIFNSGANVGALIAPLAIPWIAVHWGWRWGFLATAAFSALWIVLWMNIYDRPERHPRLSRAELKYIASGPPEPSTTVPWIRLLGKRQVWAFVLGKTLTDPVWLFYLFWLPGFLSRQYGLPIGRIGLPLVVIYNVSVIGSVVGGWLPGKLIGQGWTVNKARKTAMLIYAILVVPVVFAGRLQSVWGVTLLLSLATAAHQAWSANMFTLASDMLPQRVIASVVGMGTFGAAVLLAFLSTLIGYLLKWTGGNYAPLFVICGSAYLPALLIIHLLAPKLQPAQIE